jgi:tetratricopeptide (TPR) repeat protein
MQESSDFFVGREKEVKVFQEMLTRDDGKQWILSLVGDGGQGKTLLLHKFAKLVQERALRGERITVTPKAIDFYLTSHQRLIGLLNEIVSQLKDNAKFFEFQKIIAKYRAISLKDEDPGQLQYLVSEAQAAFIKEYCEFSKETRIVLLFDTAELAGESLDEFWTKVLPKISHNSFLVIAGRKQIQGLTPDHQPVLFVKGFNDREILAYLNKQDIDINPDAILKLGQLSSGRPILVALFADWYKDGHSPNELLSYAKEDFERAMVSYIQQIRRPEDKAILAMSHFYRRFNSLILADLLSCDVASAQNIIASLSKYSFVKYRPAVVERLSSCLLHDEMRDMVNKWVWPGVDPFNEQRTEWTEKIIDYYRRDVENEKDRLTRQNLKLELLHYWLNIDPEKAFDFSYALFDEALGNLDASFMESVNSEITSSNNAFDDKANEEMKFRAAMVLYGRENYKEAISILESLATTATGILLGKVLVYLTEMCSKSGKAEMAVEHGERCVLICKTLLDETKNSRERQRINRILALVYGNLGFTWQVALGSVEKATKHYELALSLPLDDLLPSFIAHVRNHLAYAYYFQRRLDEADALNRSAQTINLRLGIPYELGFTYYVRGMLLVATNRNEEAMSNFDDALELFTKAKNEHGKGLVFVAYGRLMRQLGWYKETKLSTSVIDGAKKDELKAANTESDGKRIQNNLAYQKSRELLANGEQIFRRHEDWPNLADVLNELGCLYRQIEDWDTALNYFNEAVAISQKSKNRHHELDCLLDVAITQYRKGDLVPSKKQAIVVKEATHLEGFDYLFSKAQHLLSDILFEESNYDEAFEAAADSCIYVLKSPTKERAFDEALDSLVALLFKLPDAELVTKETKYLSRRWAGAGLDEKFPRFLIRMNSLVDDYRPKDREETLQ